MNPLASSLRPVLALPLLALLGCGGGGYTVKGKLVNNGAPVTVSDKGVLVMSFVAVDDKTGANPYPTSIEKDGSFTVTGRGDSKGVPAGKYRVSVELQDPYPGKDKFGGKFSREKSPIVKEVTGNTDLIVDVGKDGGA